MGTGYKRQSDEKLIAAYHRNVERSKMIREALEGRGLPVPAEQL